MSNIFRGMNRKTKRQFNNLDTDKQTEFLQAAIIEKVSPIMANQIATAMIEGAKQEDERIYKKYVEEMDLYCSHGDANWINLANQMLSYFRMKHLEYEKNRLENQGDEKNDL